MIKYKPESLVQFINKYNDLRRTLKCDGYINYKKNKFKVSANVKPTPSSKNYEVEFYYKLGGIIDVYVCNLPIMSNKVIPHTYSSNYSSDKKVKLCLYMPKYKEFNHKHLLTKNILPWTYEWLYFYEFFLITGVWYGNGVHPN